MPASIILIGLPGSGKTTIGKELAKKIDFSFLDTDYLIEELEGYSISEIFENKGETYFRDLETTVIKSLLGVKNKVISIGGGAFEREENRSLLKQIGNVVYLYASVDVIYNRIKNVAGRPLLACDNPKQKLNELYIKRHPQFEQADYTIDTSNLTLYNVIDDIQRIINAKNS